MLKFVKSLLVIVFLGGVIVYATFFSSTFTSLISEHLPATGKKVLGIAVKQNQKNNLTDELKKDASSSASTAQKQLMQIKIGDIVSTLSRGQKIIHDISGLQSSVQSEFKK